MPLVRALPVKLSRTFVVVHNIRFDGFPSKLVRKETGFSFGSLDSNALKVFRNVVVPFQKERLLAWYRHVNMARILHHAVTTRCRSEASAQDGSLHPWK